MYAIPTSFFIINIEKYHLKHSPYLLFMIFVYTLGIMFIEKIVGDWLNKQYQKTSFAWKKILRKLKIFIEERHLITEEVLKYFETAYSVGVLPKNKWFEIDLSRHPNEKEIKEAIAFFEKKYNFK